MTADLTARDRFMEHVGNAVQELEEAEGTPEQINSFLTAWMKPDSTEPRVFGVPVGTIGALTLDGRSWIEVLGVVHWAQVPGTETRTLTFQVYRSGEGKKSGLGHADEVTVPVSRVVAVRRGK